MNELDSLRTNYNIKKTKKALAKDNSQCEVPSPRKKPGPKSKKITFNSDIHPYCQSCLAAHSKHWYLKDGTVYLKDKLFNEDLVICHLIHEEINVPASAREYLDPGELEIANFLQNPCSWTQAEFNWRPRDYQDLMLKCSALRKVSRIGRRAGKTEAITVKMLHYAYTHEEVTVLVIAPYKNQVGLIFDKMESFLSRSDSLKSSIKRNTKNPYRVEFHNRSKIMGFTSGTRTGSKSTGIRGQDAHLILLDEADYLGESDFEVILAIQASRPDVLVWASSTPTGKREMFWRFCSETQLGFKEFHFPSSVSPSWTKQTERLERAQYTEHGYAHEFEAEFGDEAEGVFLGKYVDRALETYEVSDCRPVRGNLYTMGVDWNTAGTGTVIIMVEWNKKFKEGRGAFKVVYKEVISQSEFTQIKACQKIITLNNIWNPSAIYVDQGYGQTQIEMLHKYGLENPKTNLVNKVTGVNFGSTIDIRDPVTKQRVKKHLKPFIVNLAVRRIEDDQIILPSSEDIKLGLVGQIRDYTVIRESAFGQPVYSDDNDHAIIAWMLAIFGATMQYSDMTQQNRVAAVGIAGKFGEKEGKEFIQNKDIIKNEIKRQATTIVPRWGKESVFKETSLRGTIMHSSARKSAQRRSNNNLTKRQQLARTAVRGRADF